MSCPDLITTLSVSNIKVMPLRARVILASTLYIRIMVVCLKKSNKTSTSASIVEKVLPRKHKVRSLVYEEPQ